MTDRDPFDLDRFVRAQDPIFGAVMAELSVGRKRSHWMWFVFPQMRGLGVSPTALVFRDRLARRGASLRPPRNPWSAPRPGDPRRAAPCRPNAHAIFGSPDDLKFRSSMTLFARIAPDGPYGQALADFYRGSEDEATLRLLDAQSG